MEISEIEENDYGAVLALNADSVPHMNLISEIELQWFVKHAALACVAKIDDSLVGFLIGLRPGMSYTSPNYEWFCENRKDFAYVDRVAVAKSARRKGVADSLYRYFAESQAGTPVMTCEINIRPPNPGSMLFHKRMGFRQIGSQETEQGKKEVALMEKTL
ncbi:MAG: GNAT family N-acetyltransferase [Woeseiaceae bacterium]|nr:GNAT family N-acetyltransferase [Woeseiaceae bacterium]